MICDEVSVLEANIDDMSGEWFGFLMETLMGAGALDVTLTPATMKKSRPGVLVGVIAKPDDEERMAELLLEHSTTLGVRITRARRVTLERHVDTVCTAYGDIRVKCAGGRAAPEYEDCAQAAREHGVAVMRVYRAALAAWEDDGEGR